MSVFGKKGILLLLCAVLLLSGCVLPIRKPSNTPVKATLAPTMKPSAIPTIEQTIEPTIAPSAAPKMEMVWADLRERFSYLYGGYDETLAFDVDGDGQKEEVTFSYWEMQEGEVGTLQVKIYKGETELAQWNGEEFFLPSVFVTADLDPTDERCEAVFSVCGMDDYCQTILFSFDESGLCQEAQIVGELDRAENGLLTICSHVHMLGDYSAYMTYRVENGAFVQQEKWWEIIHYPAGEGQRDFSLLTTIKEIPFTNLDGSQDTLPVGTKLRIIKTDNDKSAYFRTEQGLEGIITVARPDGYWMGRIDGVEETEYFEMIPYAG